VLFDSRNPARRQAARTALGARARTIDVCSLHHRGTSSGGAANPAAHMTAALDQRRTADFHARLKQRLEKLGGVWLRISEFPFPYRSVLCIAGDAGGDDLERFKRTFGPAAVSGSAAAKTGEHAHRPGLDVEDRIARCYAAGTPMFSVESAPVFDTTRSPLLWQTSVDEFARWWRIRGQIELRVWKAGGVYRIQSESGFGGFRPAVELWRGNHAASLPLTAGEMTVEESGLAFVLERIRQPNGLASLNMADDIQLISTNLRTYEPYSGPLNK